MHQNAQKLPWYTNINQHQQNTAILLPNPQTTTLNKPFLQQGR